jgi:ferric-dicitrate binding protein FerR (iron transport regulator)
MGNDYRQAEDFICDETFQLYCLGTDQSAIDFWEQWVRDNPQSAATVAEARKLFFVLNGEQGNLRQQLRELEDGMDRVVFLKEALESQPRRSRRPLYISIAATFLLLTGAGLLWKLTSPVTTSSLPALAAPIQSGKEPRKTIVLVDGSVLTMRNNSSISLAKDFSKTNRVLTLSGEAFFDVQADPAHPFIVHTRDVSIEVLGTVFNVSAYPENPYTETALFRGKVAVTPKSDPALKTILSPSQKLVTQQSGKTKEVRSLTVDPADHKAKEISWVRNRLKIQDESLEQIAKRLEDWYGIPIIITDESVKQYSYSGTFESETVIKALEALQLSYPFSFRSDQDKIVISK